MTLIQPLPLAPLIQELRNGTLSATAAVTQCLNRIDETENQVHAWVSVDREGALDAARAADELAPEQRPPLHGVPIGVKDIIDVAGMPTGCGSALRRDHVASEDAGIVRELRKLGAIVLGKTVTTEFAYFSPGPTRNPHAPEHTPGGSSSGSAAAVAAGMVPLAIGTQTAASLIRPAAYCGTYGFVSPVGTWPESGIVGLSPTLDSAGFFTADLEGMALMSRLRTPAEEAPTEQERPEVCLWRPGPAFGASSRMLEQIDQARAALERGNWRTSLVDLDEPATEMVELHTLIMGYEAARERAAEAAHPEALSPQFAQLLGEGSRTSEGEYRAALERRKAVLEHLSEQFRDRLLVAPSAQDCAPAGIVATGAPIMSRPWQLLGWPTLNCPVGKAGKLPLGIQIIGTPARQNWLLEVAPYLS